MKTTEHHRKGNGKIQQLLKQMEVGDSVVVEGTPSGVRGRFCHAAKSLNMKIVQRSLGNGRVRVWRNQ